MASISDSIIENLPQPYADFRDLETIRNVWDPILDREMSRYWDMIKEGITGFSRAQEEVMTALKKVERDETAESIVKNFLDERFPLVQDLISQMEPAVNQYPKAKGDHDDRGRSVTMDVEPPGPPNHHRRGESMAPPPRPAPPLTPVTTPAGALALQQTAKRTLDAVGADHLPQWQQRTPGSPSKKARSSLASPVPPRTAAAAAAAASSTSSAVSKSVEFWEVEGQQFIFKDQANCGSGWFVVRCGLEQRVPFLREPLRGNVAMDHFNDDDQKCHDPRRIYTFDDILRGFTYRVNDPAGDMTEERVRSANERLQREHPAAAQRGPAKKSSRKGKERAAPGAPRSAAAGARTGTSDTDGSYQDEAS